MEKDPVYSYNQALTFLEERTHFAFCLFSIFGKDELLKRKFFSPMKLQMYLVDNSKYLVGFWLVTVKRPVVWLIVDLDSVRESFSQLDLFECPLCHD